jgi:hypothetical protein
MKDKEAKKALVVGAVNVLTLSCMTYPDEGIRNFAGLAVEHKTMGTGTWRAGT